MVERSVLNAISENRLAAGRDYVSALDALGFTVEGAMWTVALDGSEPELALLTELFEEVGPKTIYDALFAAYRNAKTPESFDPWQVSVYGPNTAFYVAYLEDILDLSDPVFAVDPEGQSHLLAEVSETFGDRLTRPSWTYRKPERNDRRLSDRMAAMRKWRRFEAEAKRAA